jgi:hypothetical protein
MTRESDYLSNKLKERGERVGANPNNASSSFVQHKTIGALRDTMSVDKQARGDREDLEYRNLPIRLAWITRVPDGYRAVMTGTRYNPETVEGDCSEISKLFKATMPEISSLLLRSDNIFIDTDRPTQNPIVVEDLYAEGGLIVDDGEYTVMGKDNSIYSGYVFNKVIDFAGRSVGARLWTDGERFAFQDLIAGDEAREELPTKFVSTPTAGLWGTFGLTRDGDVAVMLPFKIKSVIGDYKKKILGHTIFGNTISIIVTPSLAKPVNATGIKNDDIGEHMNANIYYIPDTYKFFGLGTNRVDLVGDSRDLRRRQLQLYIGVAKSKKLDAQRTTDSGMSILTISL